MQATDRTDPSANTFQARPWMPAVRRPWLSLLYLPLYLLTGAVVWVGFASADVGWRLGAAALSALLLLPLALIPARHLPWPVPVVLSAGVAVASWRAFTFTWPVWVTLLIAVAVARMPASWLPVVFRRPSPTTRTVLAWFSLLSLYGFPLPLYAVASKEFSGVGVAAAGVLLATFALTLPYAVYPSKHLARGPRIIVGVAGLAAGILVLPFLASSLSLLMIGAAVDRSRKRRARMGMPTRPGL